MTSFSLFHQQYYELDKWQFAGGLRLNFYNTKITDPSFGDLRFNPTALAGNFSATYLFGPVWRLTASLNSAYRAPNINDLSSFGRFDFGIEVPSPTLKPERSLNKEILLQANYKKLNLAFAVFHNSLTDLIDRVKWSYEGDTLYMGERVYQKENIGNAVIYGFETYFKLDITNEFQFQSHLTYTYGQNRTADQPLRRIPPLFTRLGLQYEKSGFFTILNWTAAGEQTRLAPGDLSDHRINPKGTPGFGVLALRAGWRQGFFSVEGGLENILDQHYRYHGSGIDGYGRHFWLRTTLRF
jgi:outer membrane receptor protein involved in Fe transport